MKKKLVILGAGESGVGAALLGQKMAYEVFVSDKSAIKPKYQAELEAAHIRYESGVHTEGVIFEADVIVKSPGIPDNTPLVKTAVKKGIEIISEIEFAYRHTEKYIIAITGSNGKTTTTSLTYHILKNAGLKVEVGGNIGYSFARLVANEAENKNEIYVLEVSSFQLDGIVHFRPNIAILLNITPDHLDRYNYKMSEYVASKFRIAMNQTEDDVFIYNSSDIENQRYMDRKIINANLWGVAMKTEKELSAEGKESPGGLPLLRGRFDMSKTQLRGPHNYFNASCAVAAAIICGVGDAKIQAGLESFQNVEHRLEYVATVGGVDYINDSKATNVDSVFWALSAMSKPTVLILGGQDKGNDYRHIEKLVRDKVKAIVCMGVDNAKIQAFFKSFVSLIRETQSAEEAVAVATQIAETGDTVLLSPACASFDLFKNYEDRGKQFKEAVLHLTHKPI